MSTQAELADMILRDAGRGGLWEWAMDQRRSATPMRWDEVAYRLRGETEGRIQIGGAQLRLWVIAAERQRNAERAEAGE